MGDNTGFYKSTLRRILRLLVLGVMAGAAQSCSSPAIVSDVSPNIHVETYIQGLDVPWELAFAPDGRIFVTERPGNIRVVENGTLLQEPWINLDVAAVGEGGLLGLALDPNFSQNHYVYVAFTYNSAAGVKNRLVRLQEDTNARKGVMDIILLDGVAGGSTHDGGRVKFGPDGKLYWTTGETGIANLAQDVNSLNGKILRINPDGSIPADNPFPGSPVYTWGNRNPEGLAWQPGTGRMYATEHGPSGGQGGVGQDEVNFIEAGKNYGWPVITGNQSGPGMVSPVIQSGPGETWAPGGATFVTGGTWNGSLLFTGLRGETLYRLLIDENNPVKVNGLEKYFVGQFGRLRDVVQGPDGAFYILTNNRDGRGIPKPGDDKILRVTVP